MLFLRSEIVTASDTGLTHYSCDHCSAARRIQEPLISGNLSNKEGLLERLGYWLSVGLGLGLVPVAPGTFGSLLGPPLVWSVQQGVPFAWCRYAIGILLILLGVPICRIGARQLGKEDPGAVVYDEIAAFFVVFALVPVSWKSAGIGFLLFRLFDITKPWPIRRLEKLPDGWGVMADDLLAGLYAGISLFALVTWVLPYFS